MDPAEHNITVYRDRDFSKPFVLKDGNGAVINLTNYEADAQIRPVKDSTELIVAFTTVIDAAAGRVTISLTDVQALAITQSKGWWDLVLTNPSGLRQSYVEGAVAIKGTVTRE